MPAYFMMPCHYALPSPPRHAVHADMPSPRATARAAAPLFRSSFSRCGCHDAFSAYDCRLFQPLIFTPLSLLRLRATRDGAALRLLIRYHFTLPRAHSWRYCDAAAEHRFAPARRCRR